jgi:hypothetical protein
VFGDITFDSPEEKKNKEEFHRIYSECPIPADEILGNMGLFLTPKTLSRILFMDYLYQKIIDTQGIIIEFGTRWGQNASLFSTLRGIYEPFNRHRKIVAFDTFKGFPDITVHDGNSELMKVGVDSVTPDYKNYLERLMSVNEKLSPMSHIKKFEIIEGDAVHELKKYLESHPETIISLAYFDFDLYKPTLRCLNMIKPYLVKGSVLAFDELNDHDSPGETVALKEAFKLNEIELKRYRYTSRTSYFEV